MLTKLFRCYLALIWARTNGCFVLSKHCRPERSAVNRFYSFVFPPNGDLALSNSVCFIIVRPSSFSAALNAEVLQWASERVSEWTKNLLFLNLSSHADSLAWRDVWFDNLIDAKSGCWLEISGHVTLGITNVSFKCKIMRTVLKLVAKKSLRINVLLIDSSLFFLMIDCGKVTTISMT
jgi:hypothetical protein